VSDQRLGVALEECHVRAEAADGHVGGERAAAPGRRQGLAHERRLAVAARGDQEDLLPGLQIAGQALELRLAVDESRGRHDLAVDEGVGHRLRRIP
jgi:hypothetical protein